MAIAVSPARLKAASILARVQDQGAYASVLLASLPESNLKSSDRALVRELVLGSLRWRGTLDYFIEKYARRRVDQIDLPVLTALRIGLYQLRFLTRIPARAAVSESVNLTRRLASRGAAGLVNAVLRQAARSPHDEPGTTIADPIDRLAVQTSHPRWLLDRWIGAFGFEQTHALALSNNQPSRSAFRVNTLLARQPAVLGALRDQGLRFEPSALTPNAFIALDEPRFASSELVRSGLIYLQDEGSQLISILADPRDGERILDLCAAPGSKTSHLAALTSDRAFIVACDLHPSRLRVLARTASRLNARSIAMVVVDGTVRLPFFAANGTQGIFDLVLVDAPCSGTGTLRQNPEIKWRLTARDLTRLGRIQLNMLRQGAAMLRPGGRLVYSTCSLEREEGEEVVNQFLEESPGFSPIRPAPGVVMKDSVVSPNGFVRTAPHREGTDGFFAAIFTRGSANP